MYLLEATIKAVETVDICLKEVVTAILEIGGIPCIVADHGNAEQMKDNKGELHTAHKTNPVPFILVNNKFELGSDGVLYAMRPLLYYNCEIYFSLKK
ncbi:3-bisphosphoglycerate-independent phosphoglycerate mutase [Columbia Basin potato purple top phytoplasma]|uniref:3-bisphosphoglycerate-independent phosphoglycerate mutase n=1 Tax=Columbia Basin potato purple top phytoplasma TaxID=307134 RepID=A0ABT5LAS0_9MOLU|nr:3-bisphosphoglycerate-independent phosphoglycerate mutase [Columbia Basin potato purple top phytoplasma]